MSLVKVVGWREVEIDVGGRMTDDAARMTWRKGGRKQASKDETKTRQAGRKGGREGREGREGRASAHLFLVLHSIW